MMIITRSWCFLYGPKTCPYQRAQSLFFGRIQLLVAVIMLFWPYSSNLAVLSCFLAVFRLDLHKAMNTVLAMQAKKAAVLDVLLKHKTAMTLQELLQILGQDFAERSVRRWLQEMVTEGLINKIGQKKSSHYQVNVSETNNFIRPHSEAIQYIQQAIFKRDPAVYNAQWLDNYKPNHTYYLPEKNRKELLSHGQRDHKDDAAGTFARHIYNRLLIDLSYNSSRLEGNTYSLLDTQRLILEGNSAEGKLDEERIMILNHKEAICHLVESAPTLQINVTEICTLHYLLADGLVPTQYAGKIRDHGVRISASTYMPLENQSQIENQLLTICEKAAAILDLFEQSFFLLTHLAYLQAFTDVNKRTSRLSANIPLICGNLIPLSFNYVEKDDYIANMLCIYELNDTRPLADLYCQSYLRTCQEYSVTSDIFQFDEIRVRYRPLRRELIRHIITKKLTGNKLQNYLKKQIHQHIPATDRDHFAKTVDEDLTEISPQRIAGLGISIAELQAWLEKNAATGHTPRE